MSDSKPYAQGRIPLPFAAEIGTRGASNRLPLAFRRPFGYADNADIKPPEPDKPEPYRPPAGYAAVSQGWGFVQQAVAVSAACFQTAFTQTRLDVDFETVSLPSEKQAACLQTAFSGMEALHGEAAAAYRPSEKAHGCGSVSISSAPSLYACEAAHFSADAFLAAENSDGASAQSAPPLENEIRPTTAPDKALAACLTADTAPAAPLQSCFAPQYQAAESVPCEWYEIPIEPEPDTGDKTYICGLRPPSNRMALRFARHKIAHAAHSVPLPFACSDTAETPILQGYIMQNTVSAAVDGQPLGLFSASFTCDTGGYCWQGSVTVPPDDFVRLNMDGRTKGQEAVITCQINGDTFVILAEEYSDNRRFGQKSYTVSGRSRTAYLGGDYAPKDGETYRAPIYAAQIANEQVKGSGFTVESWAAADWLIPANVYSAAEKPPMAVLQELAAAAGAFVCSDTAAPVLRVKPKWPRPAWEIADAEADVSIPTSVVFGISGRKTVSERANGVFVWATHNSGQAADVYRKGSDREPRASAVSGALYTDQPVLLAAGIAALSATGTHKTETVSLPVSDKYAVPLAQLGQIWQINEPAGAFKGVVTGVTLEVSIENDAPVVSQSVVIDRYLDD